jgi:cytochrome c oxidase cbb3-type subunit 3
VRAGPASSWPAAGPPRALGDPPYDVERNAWAVGQGKRWYRWFNCSGCHAMGGGDKGPALMDASWRYGGAAGDIVESIRGGRPDGMPAFGGRIADDQLWQLAAYVQSMSAMLRTDVMPGRGDSMASGEPEQRRERP